MVPYHRAEKRFGTERRPVVRYPQRHRKQYSLCVERIRSRHAIRHRAQSYGIPFHHGQSFGRPIRTDPHHVQKPAYPRIYRRHITTYRRRESSYRIGQPHTRYRTGTIRCDIQCRPSALPRQRRYRITRLVHNKKPHKAAFFVKYRLLLGNILEQCREELPITTHRGNLHFLIGRMRVAQSRPERNHLHLGIFFPYDTAFQSGMDNHYLRVDTERIVMNFFATFRNGEFKSLCQPGYPPMFRPEPRPKGKYSRSSKPDMLSCFHSNYEPRT